MDTDTHSTVPESNTQAASRKKDHIDLAFESQVAASDRKRQFSYEPLLSGHPESAQAIPFDFATKQQKHPIWVSSMTGGTAHARSINQQLARVCGEFGLGMGLGSCRSLLYSDEYLADFQVRSLITSQYPLFANLGIAQVEQLVAQNDITRLEDMIEKLEADGLIIHVNPTQEWLQPEGDRFTKAPIDTIRSVLSLTQTPIIVKEVGQGMGYQSLAALLQLPLVALEFASHGGTNFAMLELLRSDPIQQECFSSLAYVGHSAEEMVDWCNLLRLELKKKIQCHQIIVSGGVRTFLDGYYFINKLQFEAVYGQAAPFLKYAQQPYDALKQYVQNQVNGLAYANTYLKIK